MWETFGTATLAAIALLYLSGYLFWRGLHLSPIVALCCAPLYSMAAYALLPIGYYEIGISCSVATVAIPPLALGILAALVSRLKNAKKGADADTTTLGLTDQPPARTGPLHLPRDIALPLAYVIAATMVCAFVFVSNLPRPDAFYSRYDNQTHINAVQAFVDSGKWSSLHESAYLASPINATPTSNNTGGFYPSAWHDLNALVCLCSGANVTIAANATIVALTCVVFPLGMYVLMSALFGEERYAVGWGALATSAFSTWPWVYLIKGPCYPNLLGLSLMVASLGTVVLCVEQKLVRNHLPAFIALVATSFVSLGLAHPNTLFTAYVMLAPYGAYVIWHADMWRRPDGRTRKVSRAAVVSAFLAAVVGFWVLCYSLPIFRDILSKDWWDKSESFAATLKSLALLQLTISSSQYAMCLACLAGTVACVRKRQMWLLAPIAFWALCFVGSQVGWQAVKYWLGGMWYMTAYRFTANLTICLIPLAALGLALAHEELLGSAFFQHATHAAVAHPPLSRRLGIVAFGVGVCVLTFAFPTFRIPLGKGLEIRPPFQSVRDRITQIYADDIEHVYSTEEVAFVERALPLVPDHALVVNDPNDGSMWAYGVNGMNTLFRRYETRGHTDQAKLIRSHLDEYATNEEVQKAIGETGAQYVLQLDHGVTFDDGVWIPYLTEKGKSSWSGIDAIDEKTPGFEVVLSDGDQMRLYKILPMM